MAFLLLYLDKGMKLDVDRLQHKLLASERVTPIPAGDRYCFSCEYRTSEDMVEIGIRHDGKTIIVDGMDEAAFAAAVDIQKHVNEPLHIVDESYTFDLPLEKYRNGAELECAIRDAGG